MYWTIVYFICFPYCSESMGFGLVSSVVSLPLPDRTGPCPSTLQPEARRAKGHVQSAGVTGHPFQDQRPEPRVEARRVPYPPRACVTRFRRALKPRGRRGLKRRGAARLERGMERDWQQKKDGKSRSASTQNPPSSHKARGGVVFSPIQGPWMSRAPRPNMT